MNILKNRNAKINMQLDDEKVVFVKSEKYTVMFNRMPLPQTKSPCNFSVGF